MSVNNSLAAWVASLLVSAGLFVGCNSSNNSTPTVQAASVSCANPTPMELEQERDFADQYHLGEGRAWARSFNQTHNCGDFETFKNTFLQSYNYGSHCMRYDPHTALQYAETMASQYSTGQVPDMTDCQPNR